MVKELGDTVWGSSFRVGANFAVGPIRALALRSLMQVRAPSTLESS